MALWRPHVWNQGFQQKKSLLYNGHCKPIHMWIEYVHYSLLPVSSFVEPMEQGFEMCEKILPSSVSISSASNRMWGNYHRHFKENNSEGCNSVVFWSRKLLIVSLKLNILLCFIPNRCVTSASS